MRLLSCFLLLFTLNLFAQDVKLIDGRVRFVDGIQRSVRIENKKSGEKVNADSTGFFSINVEKGDVLVFRAEAFPERSIVISGNEGAYFGIILSEQELDEIVIDRKLFVDNYFGDIAKYTQAERQYRSSNTMFFGDGIMGFGLDPLVNLINGKRKAQKTTMRYEKQEYLKERFLEFFTATILQEEFDIDENHITGFVYFLVVQPSFEDMIIDLSPEFKLYVSEMYSQFLGL